MRTTVCAAAIALMLSGSAHAAEITGVAVYPGAKYDEQWSRKQAAMAKETGANGAGACYLTGDPVRKVAEFYQKEGFRVSFGEVTDDSARLQKGDAVSLAIKNIKSPDNKDESRICINKQ